MAGRGARWGGGGGTGEGEGEGEGERGGGLTQTLQFHLAPLAFNFGFLVLHINVGAG